MKLSLLLLLLFFSCVGCAKVNYKYPPKEIKIEDNNGSVLLSFANHATLRDIDEEYSSYMFTESLDVEIPEELESITYISSNFKPSLRLYINQVRVCSYNYMLGKYVSNCPKVLTMDKFDVISIEGIPRGNTITLKLNYMRNL